MAKRRWWLADERFKAVHQKLRANYDVAVKRIENKHADELHALNEKVETRIKDEYRRHSQELAARDALAARLGAEIARIRLEFGPRGFGTRFQLSVTMEESFIMNARDLKECAPYIVEVMVARIKQEFSQIDFARAQPVVPNNMPGKDYWPKWSIEA